MTQVLWVSVVSIFFQAAVVFGYSDSQRGEVKSFIRSFDVKLEDCKKKYRVYSGYGSGGCAVADYDAQPYLIYTVERRRFTYSDDKGQEHKVLIKGGYFELNASGYSIDYYGTEKTEARWERVEPYLRQAIQSLPVGKITATIVRVVDPS